MKKILSVVIAITFSLFLFAGCTHKAGTAVTGIAFKQSIFYFDLNVPTKLEYKILPSSASYHEPTITLDNEFLDNRISSYNGLKDTFIINDESFESAKFTIKYSTGSGVTYEDTCEVRLKEYPTHVYVGSGNSDLDENSKFYISSRGIAQIPLLGLFGSEEKTLDTSYYKFVVASSDSTVITVENQQNIVVKSTGKQGKATINIKVVASDGSKIKDGLEENVDVIVNNNVSNCTLFTTYENNESEKVSTIYRDLKTSETEFRFDNSIKNNTYIIEPVLLDSDGYVVENIGYTIVSLNEEVIKVVDNGDGTFSLVALTSGQTDVLITSNGYGGDGSAVIFKVSCNSIIS